MDWLSLVLGTGAGVAGLTAIGLCVYLGRHEAAEKHGREQARQAPLVAVALSVESSEVRLVITNFGVHPVRQVKLMDVRRRNGDPRESWRAAFRVPPAPTERDLLVSGATFRMALWLLDSAGQRLTQVADGPDLTYRIRFRAVGGRWWLLSEDSTRPAPVPLPRYPW
ncbi:hypothetical protein OTB20_39475 [Streptomyces sp. H27-H1]|uniref:hypothetical protein n=1 Tax=Streptomyces sp. H27-H1 TaxID=2996461 RepID=UPI002271B55B|nr:hypothetical protein [Streptomyces sp. H27-H1]MCY0932145.1 hypothetical protein [Streptomyces sp. H27-H1]